MGRKKQRKLLQFGASEEDIYSAKRRLETATKRFEKRQLMAS